MGKEGKTRAKIAEVTRKIILCKEKIGFGNKSRKMTIKIPNRSRERRKSAIFLGKTAASTRPPSKGGIGIRLKTAKTTLISEILAKKTKTSGEGVRLTAILAISPKITAKIRFEAGPAKPISPISFLGFLRLKGSIGTGLAAPIMIGEPVVRRISGRRMLVTGSIWGIGFKVNRPESLAVGSPNFSATKP